jgi:hypothetical protein
VRTENMLLRVAAIAGLTLMSEHAFAEELTAASSGERAVRSSYEAAAARSAKVAAEARMRGSWTDLLSRYWLGSGSRAIAMSLSTSVVSSAQWTVPTRFVHTGLRYWALAWRV